jgi:hypothetical protein
MSRVGFTSRIQRRVRQIEQRPTIRFAENARNPMLFPIMIFLMVLSPLYIPIAVTVLHEFGNWRTRRIARPADSLRQLHQAVGLVPAVA